MHDGCRILEWIHQNQQTLTGVAQRVGFSRQLLSHALHTNHLSPRLTHALWEQLGLRVHPTCGTRRPNAKDRPPSATSSLHVSKLDPYRDDIIDLLAQGTPQHMIARRFGTSDSNLSHWLHKRGLKRRGRVS